MMPRSIRPPALPLRRSPSVPGSGTPCPSPVHVLFLCVLGGWDSTCNKYAKRKARASMPEHTPNMPDNLTT